tara:strand:- start:419 stop:616 length:198 start_codon:yes stop_codon:yes gene_type:complete
MINDDVFELYTFFIEYVDKVQTNYIPRVSGVGCCSFGKWRTHESKGEWTQTSDRRMQRREVGNDK